VIDLVGTWLAHPLPSRVLRSQNVQFDADHMIERCRLFLLIALGESVLTSGTAIAGAPRTLTTLWKPTRTKRHIACSDDCTWRFSGKSLTNGGSRPTGMQQAGRWTRPDLWFWCGAPRRNRTGDPILTMEPPVTAVRNAVTAGHARP
jgi:hypothetical protein